MNYPHPLPPIPTGTPMQMPPPMQPMPASGAYQAYPPPGWLASKRATDTRNILLRNWLVISLSLFLITNYIILWARLPPIYGSLVAGTLPFAAAFIYAIHRLVRDPQVIKTIGLKFFLFMIFVYLGSMMYFAAQIPKQSCTNVQ